MPNRISLSDVVGDVCSAPDCTADPMPDTPLPICVQHYIAVVRHYHQLARGSRLVETEWEQHVGLGTVPRDPVVEVRESVYFIRYRDRVKVGTTTNVRQRLTALPYDEVLGVIPGGRDVESYWHERLAAEHDRGEWFRATDHVLSLISAAVA